MVAIPRGRFACLNLQDMYAGSKIRATQPDGQPLGGAMPREKGNKHIRHDVLPSLDKALWHQLELVWRKAEEGILEAQRHALGHQGGYNHVRAVEDNVSALIPDDWKGVDLPALDLFLLSAASCLHDTGKVGDTSGDHGHKSRREICNRPQDFELDRGQAEAIAWLVHAHNDKNLDALPSGPFSIKGSQQVNNLRLLAALLCLADTLHCDRSRASPQVIKMLPEAENQPVTKFRQLVRGWVFNEQNHIVIQATAEKLSDIEIFHAGFVGLKQEVEPIAPTLATYGFPYQLVPGLDDSALSFQPPHLIAKQVGLPGMDFYHEEDASIFKGRDKDIEQLYQIILSSPVALLIGDSGMGKSSLVCAGLFPYIDKLGTWKHLWSRPFAQPTKFLVSDIYSVLLKEAKPVVETIITSFERLSLYFDRYELVP